MTRSAGIVVNIDANSRKLDKAFNKAERKVKKSTNKMAKSVARMQKQMNKSFSLIKGGLAAVGVGIGVNWLEALAKANRETLAWSKSIGISVKDLEAWSFIARQAGLEGDKIADIFKDINEKVGEYTLLGTGAGADIFKKLGLTADELRKKRPDKILELIADKSKALSKQEKTAVFEALASDLSKLIPFLEQGKGGFKEIREELEKKGSLVSDETAERLERLNKKWDEFKSKTLAESKKRLADVGEAAISGMGMLERAGRVVGNVYDAARNTTADLFETIAGGSSVLQSWVTSAGNALRSSAKLELMGQVAKTLGGQGKGKVVDFGKASGGLSVAPGQTKFGTPTNLMSRYKTGANSFGGFSPSKKAPVKLDIKVSSEKGLHVSEIKIDGATATIQKATENAERQVNR